MTVKTVYIEKGTLNVGNSMPKIRRKNIWQFQGIERNKVAELQTRRDMLRNK